MNVLLKYIFGFILFLNCTCLQVQAQFGLNLLKRVDYDSLHGCGLAGCWGYTDEFGNEYALVGGNAGISILDISNPFTPTEKLFSPGPWCMWREIQTYNNYAYVTSECSTMRIIDLSPLPASLDSSSIYSFLGDTTVEFVPNGHSLFISSDGILFYNGANGGVILYDLNVNPINPPQIGKHDLWWVHDSYERNDTLYCANINEGFFSILDVSDPSNIQFLGSEQTPKKYTHNCALTSDGNILFITDEIADAPLSAFDVSDVSDIKKITEFKHHDSSNAIPHNVYIKDDFLYAAIYSEGITVFDISNPVFPILVAHYDTYPLNNNSALDGCWGAYPHFNSGKIIASDVTNGLYIFQPTFSVAPTIEGIITDSVTLNPLANVSVRLLQNSTTLVSQINGYYKHGYYQADTIQFEFSKSGYITDTITVILNSTGTIIRNVKLKPIPYISYQFTVKNSRTFVPIENILIDLKNNTFDYSGSTDINGNFYIPQLFLTNGSMDYELIIGQWGYKSFCDDNFTFDTTMSGQTFYLSPEYYDDFHFDYNWDVQSVTSDTESVWVCVIPLPVTNPTLPDTDDTEDCGEKAFLTGNDSAADYFFSGSTSLISPVMDLSYYSDPYLTFKFWFRSLSMNDTCHIYLQNDSTILLGNVSINDSISDTSWRYHQYRIKDFTTSLSNVKIIFKAVNYPSSGVFDVAMDHFYIKEMDSTIGINEIEIIPTGIMLFPNPANTELNISSVYPLKETMITDLAGKILIIKQVNQSNLMIDVSELSKGVYLLRSIDIDGKESCNKFIKN